MGIKRRVAAGSAWSGHDAYIAAVKEANRRADVRALHDLVREVAPELGPCMEFGMLGYGKLHYQYASGREGDSCKIGISNRKQYISLYCLAADGAGYVAERFKQRLPKASIGRSCVRFRHLSDLDEGALRELIRATADTPFGM